MIDQLHQIIDLIENTWAGKRILVVGDVMLDKYIWGDVRRISPEAPVPIVRITHQSEKPGGAANVAMNLAHLGAQVIVAGFTGNDADEELLTQRLNDSHIRSAFVSCANFPTITKLRILGGHQQIVRLDKEYLADRDAADYARLAQTALGLLPGIDAVILSDYAKGVLTHTLCQQIIVAARARQIPVLVDPKNTDFSRYRGATTICPNLGELSAAARIDSSSLDALLDAGTAMPAAFDLQYLIATLSEKGIALLRPNRRFIAPAVSRQVFDVSGAGDTVIAVLALCLASRLEPEIGIQLANVAAGVVVAKVGTVPIEKYELLAALAPDLAVLTEGKVVTRHHLAAQAVIWKLRGERVVFTNGCFDLLHIGHITILERARGLGDRLIVAINSDASVSALKGPKRPIVNERERARVLAALAAVDAVVIFDEPTPLEAIISSRPDVLVKGGDYTLDTIVGAAEVISWGGQVKIIPIVEGHSTTRLIEKGAEK